jgi:hypothetical protein
MHIQRILHSPPARSSHEIGSNRLTLKSYGCFIENEKAVKAKLQALEQEFDHFREATNEIKWCREAWWDESRLTLRDWQTADSWFRSRVLEFPKLGIGMAPVLDFANHSFQESAYYSVGENSNVVLLLREDKMGGLRDGEEITIKCVRCQ